MPHLELMFGKRPGDTKDEVVDVNSEKDFPSLGKVLPKTINQDSKWQKPNFDPF